MTSKVTVSLSKCCLLLFVINLTCHSFAQNVISVKKKTDTTNIKPTVPESSEEVVEIDLAGFYYSDPFTLGTGVPGEPPSDFRRMIVYIDSYNRVYLFHSTKSVKKLYEKFAKDPNKLTEEFGSLELTEYGNIYLNTRPTATSVSSYKYVGELISEKEIYLEYKASLSTKVGLQIYLHKY